MPAIAHSALLTMLATALNATGAIAWQEQDQSSPTSPAAAPSPADTADSTDGTAQTDAGTPASANRMTFRSLRGPQQSSAPFSNVGPIDDAFSLVTSFTDAPRYATSWQRLLSYWYARGFVADDYSLLYPGRRYFYQGNDGRVRRADTLGELLIDDRPLLQFNGPVFQPRTSDFFNGTAFGRGRTFGTNFGFGGGFHGGFNYGRYYDNFVYGFSRSTYNAPPLVEIPRLIDWNLFIGQPEPPEPEPVDPAAEALEDEAWTRAAAVYLARDNARDIESDDRSNLRLAALMYALDGQIERAARDLATALADQPALRDTPIDGDALGLEFSDLMSLQSRVARQAVRTGEAELWALAATLADARGSSMADRVWQRYDRALAAEQIAPSQDD